MFDIDKYVKHASLSHRFKYKHTSLLRKCKYLPMTKTLAFCRNVKTYQRQTRYLNPKMLILSTDENIRLLHKCELLPMTNTLAYYINVNTYH
jgi:hypothetical protein